MPVRRFAVVHSLWDAMLIKFSGRRRCDAPARTYPSDSEARSFDGSVARSGARDRRRRFNTSQDRFRTSSEDNWDAETRTLRRRALLLVPDSGSHLNLQGVDHAAVEPQVPGIARLVLYGVCHGRAARLRSVCAVETAAAPDRSALCDFFDSQRAFAPPGRVRGPRAAREGSGALGDAILRNSYSLEASGTVAARRGAGVPSPTTASSEANARPKPTTYH